MKLSRSKLKPSSKPLHGFGGKLTLPVGNIMLPVSSFKNFDNGRIDYITFDIVDILQCNLR